MFLQHFDNLWAKWIEDGRGDERTDEKTLEYMFRGVH